ncbi:hypothetical protein [Ralstonia pseudosolanacearum]|uniref:hypothetical protein n=1 Tax=Ralstonia pseudosolanacearum TaxID=1310165 RepID=UPI003CF71C8B
MLMQTAEPNTQSDLYPKVGELWNCQGRTAFVCGNSISESGRIWIADWDTGQRGDAKPEWLELRQDRRSLFEEDILAKFVPWSRAGNSDAIWWLGWWFEGVNHPKSVWYYVAALRADAKGHGWAFERIVSDARTAYMCAGVPQPDIAFLDEIPEMRGLPIQSDWAAAVASAEAAVHVAALEQVPARVTLARSSAPAKH